MGMEKIYLYKTDRDFLTSFKDAKRGLCAWVIGFEVWDKIYEIKLELVKLHGKEKSPQKAMRLLKKHYTQWIRELPGIKIVRVFRQPFPREGLDIDEKNWGDYFVYVNKKGNSKAYYADENGKLRQIEMVEVKDREAMKKLYPRIEEAKEMVDKFPR